MFWEYSDHETSERVLERVPNGPDPVILSAQALGTGTETGTGPGTGTGTGFRWWYSCMPVLATRREELTTIRARGINVSLEQKPPDVLRESREWGGCDRYRPPEA